MYPSLLVCLKLRALLRHRKSVFKHSAWLHLLPHRYFSDRHFCLYYRKCTEQRSYPLSFSVPGHQYSAQTWTIGGTALIKEETFGFRHSVEREKMVDCGTWPVNVFCKHLITGSLLSKWRVLIESVDWSQSKNNSYTIWLPYYKTLDFTSLI